MVTARSALEGLGWATVEFHDRIASTSDRARELLGEGATLPAAVVAARQSRGRGRRGRGWQSDTARGLWFTLARSDLPAAAGPVLPLRVGLAVARALDALLREPPDARPLPPPPPLRVKWPNDLLAGGAKVAGILCERVRGAVLVGIGVNLNHSASELPAGLVPPAGSLRIFAGRTLPREAAFVAIVRELRGLWDRPGPDIPPPELAQLNARSALGGVSLAVTGAARTAAGALREVALSAATGGPIHADGALEILGEAGTPLRLVAGSVAPTLPRTSLLSESKPATP